MQSDFQKRAEELYQTGAADGFRSGFVNVLKHALEDAALSTDAEPVGVRCTGCGSPWTDEDLAYQKSRRPKLLSCCPERKMIPVYAAPPAPAVAVKAKPEADDYLISTLESLVEDNVWSGWAIKQAIEIIRGLEEDLPYHCDVCTTTGHGDAPCSPLCERPALSAQVQDVAVQDDTELEEIADGAWGDDPATRGRARDELARRRAAAPAAKQGGAE